jgi:integrase
MGRQQQQLYWRDGRWYARFYSIGKCYRLSTGTADQAVANARLPAIVNARLSWEQLQETTAHYNANPGALIGGFEQYHINPPVSVQMTADGVRSFLQTALSQGHGTYDPKTGEWRIKIEGNPPQTFFEGLKSIETALKTTDQISDIAKFYSTTMVEHYTDKIFARRCSEIWLKFLSEKNIKSWSEIDEPLLKEFKAWRSETAMPRNQQKDFKPPSVLTINRHIRFLSKSFEIAVSRDYLHHNPIKFWRPDSHQATLKQGLSIEELKKVFSDSVWNRDYLNNGLMKVNLGYKLIDFIYVLFLSCKRRKEIINLEIENINYNNNYAYYEEHKNSSKGTQYVTKKAFYLSPLLKKILKRVIGDRIEGPVFPVPDEMKRTGTASIIGRLNGDYISELFTECLEKYAPQKDSTLHCLRHTATSIMENTGLSDDQIDAALGHYNVKTALPFYQDRSIDAIAKRLAGRTRPGIECLSKSMDKIIR